MTFITQGIGDINSTAIGSAARYNSGKVALELIPLEIVARSFHGLGDSTTPVRLLELLGKFQFAHVPRAPSSHSSDIIDAIIGCAVEAYGLSVWSDCAAVFDYGRKKYAEWNWLKGMPFSAVIGSAARHLIKMIDGESLDPESGLVHSGHLMCNLVMLRTYLSTYPEGDDRPRPATQPTTTTGDC